MARVRTSELVSEISGDVGGVTIVNNDISIFIRNKVTPLYVNTKAQATSKAILSYVSSNWPWTAEETRLAFARNSFLFPLRNRLGQAFTQSGFGLWMRINVTRTQCNFPLGETAPASYQYPLFSFFLFDFSLSSLKCQFAISGTTATFKLFVYVSKPVSAGRKPPARASMRLVGIYDVANTGSINIYSDWLAAVDNLPYGAGMQVSAAAYLFVDAVTIRSSGINSGAFT